MEMDTDIGTGKAVDSNHIRGWARAVAPALIWLLVRWAGKALPPAGEMCLTGAGLAAAAWALHREKGKAVFRLEGNALPQSGKALQPSGKALPQSWKALLLYAGIGAAIGISVWGLSRVWPGIADVREISLYSFLMLCLLGPAAEEIIYRGLVYGRCREFLPEAGAVLVSSLLFAAAHGTMARMIAALVMGALLCLARKRTGGIAAPMIMHMTANLAAFCLDFG